jgi:hypothetical protein
VRHKKIITAYHKITPYYPTLWYSNLSHYSTTSCYIFSTHSIKNRKRIYCCKQRTSDLTIHQFSEHPTNRPIYIITLTITHYFHWRKTNIFMVSNNKNTSLRKPQLIILLCSLWGNQFGSQHYPLTAIGVNGKQEIFIVKHTIRCYKQWNLTAKLAPWIADTPHCTKQCMTFEIHYTHAATRHSYSCFDKSRGYDV